MWHPYTEISRNSQSAGVSFVELDEESSKLVISKVHQTFGDSNKKKGRFFEQLLDAEVTHDIDGLEWIEKYPSESHVYVFADEKYGNKVFEFKSIKDAISVYRRSVNFTTYIVGLMYDYLFVITDEDPIVGAGNGADWIDKKPPI